MAVRSVCGLSSAAPKISALDACTKRTSPISRTAASISATARPLMRPVVSGSCHDWKTELTAARL